MVQYANQIELNDDIKHVFRIIVQSQLPLDQHHTMGYSD